LVQWSTDLADREGLLVFLEAMPSAEVFYEKFEFVKVSTATHDLSKWGGEGTYTHVMMVREPKKV
jgi:hypothetical protein